MLGSFRQGLTKAIFGVPAVSNLGIITADSRCAAHQLSQSRLLPCLQIIQNQAEGFHTSQAAQDAVPGQNAPSPPWTPTAQLTKRKILTKRMGFLLQAS